MYSSSTCAYCHRAEALLARCGVVEIEKINIDQDQLHRQTMIERTGLRTVPQIFIGDYHVGGYDKLYALDQRGDLKRLLEK